ncbi:hypothetical protein SETIT_4G115700v2 [Setaria italica]|uniref:Uncharacterized protein n=1 Tax=Setaria italica TaxID=4555 RepID=A0A368QTQ6_SETIT|nr:hypothetical protein SETIT_4G115700v2 [Setaria italica]
MTVQHAASPIQKTIESVGWSVPPALPHHAPATPARPRCHRPGGRALILLRRAPIRLKRTVDSETKRLLDSPVFLPQTSSPVRLRIRFDLSSAASSRHSNPRMVGKRGPDRGRGIKLESSADVFVFQAVKVSSLTGCKKTLI